MVDIRQVKHSENTEELTDLFQVCFNESMSPEHWNWKYIQNPAAPVSPEVVVATEDGKIVGARPYLLGQMWFGNEKLRTALHCETMVHPDHQRKGLFGRMGKFAIELLKTEGYSLSYGFPNPLSRQGFLKQGYKIVTQTEALFRIVRPKRLISYKLGHTFAGLGPNFFYDAFLKTRTRKLPHSTSTFEVQIHDRFTDVLRDVDALKDNSGMDIERSEAFLQWRFDHHPEKFYRYVTLTTDSGLSGYAVVSVQEGSDGIIFGIIVDYLVKDNNAECFNLLMRQCLIDLEKSDCDIIIISAFSKPVFRHELVKRLGFKSSVKFPYNRFFQYEHLDAILLDEQLSRRVDIYDKNNWHVTYTYWDTR